MITINVTFTDEEMARLKKVKGPLNWHDFIMKLAVEKGKKRANSTRSN